MQQFAIPIVQKTYDLYRALHELHPGIPKADRYTVWRHCEKTTLKMMEGLLQTSYLPQEFRSRQLVSVSAQLDMIRVFVRLSFDVRAIAQKKYIDLQEKLDEIGRMMGGWMKSVKQR